MARFVKRGINFFVGSRAFLPLASLVSALDTRRPNTLRVLTYHRIGHPGECPHLAPNTLSTTPPAFQRQLELLRDQFHVVSIHEVLDAFCGHAELPPRSVLVTFDDAYLDFESAAWPLLREFKVPALLFVPTAFPGRPERAFWWDELHDYVWRPRHEPCLATPIGKLPIETARQKAAAVRQGAAHFTSLPAAEAQAFLNDLIGDVDVRPVRPSVLCWDKLRALADQGLDLGVHTRTHPWLPRLTMDQARDEIVGARDDLRREIGRVANVFAYPGGALSEETVRVVREAGFELAFTTCRGANLIEGCDPLRLRRINVGQRTTNAVLSAQLALRPQWFNRLCRT